MHPLRTWRAPRVRLSILFPIVLLLAVAAALWWPTASPAPAACPDAPELADDPATAPPRRDPATARLDEPEADPREEVAPPATAEPDFAARIDELVHIGQRTAELAQQDDRDEASASDAHARARFAELMGLFPDAGERALAMLAELPDTPAEPLVNGRRVVLQLVLTTECERRDHDAGAFGDRSRVDPLVQSVLDTMPGTSLTAEVGGSVLVRQRFLRAVHEPGVLALLRLAAEERFRRDLATDLLLTLWDNLQQFGERSSDELSRLALLLLADADPSQRTAACRQLLKDTRYRGLVLAWVRERNDRTVANELAGTAARELPPAEALALLRELAPTLPRAPNAYLVLGFRAPEVVADDYRQLLAADTHPDVRCDLVTGVGMTRTDLGREIAELALHHDPSPEVRLQAVFALTTRGDPALGERAIQQLLDDPAIAQDPQRLSALVLALQNLEAAGDLNTIDRIGQRLRGLPLPPAGRQALAAMLQRCLPGGQSASPGGGPR